MKSIALLSCFALLLPGCGNWSNDDLEFLNAMPTKEQLTSKLPVATGTELRGEGTRRDALGIGEPSKLYADTKGASTGFNRIVGFMVDVLEAVRSYPATTHSKNQRIWGPWEDTVKSPGFEFRVVITRIDNTKFTYAFEIRPKGGDYFAFVTGEFKPTPKLREGSGSFVLYAGEAVAHNLPNVQDLKSLDTIQAAYVTDQFPITMIMKFTNKPGQSVDTLDYGYQENKDKSGGLGFTLKGMVDPNILQLDVSSAWLASGAGYGTYAVTEGNYKGASHFECWDNAFNTVYVNETWDAGMVAGDKNDCVTVANFPKP
jgi:hypothetical protein